MSYFDGLGVPLSLDHLSRATNAASSELPEDDDAAIAEAWAAGELAWLMRPHQREVYEDMRNVLWGGSYVQPRGTERRYVLKCHRRYGKSFGCGGIAAELCIQVPGSRVYWAAETQKQVTRIILPNMRKLLESCPEHIRPEWKKADGYWLWPNGSEIHIAGCEDEEKADRLRGDGADLFIIDEAGSIKPLRYVYRSIALWMVADRGGRIIMPSSPAKSPAHDFTSYCLLAEQGEGGYSKRTVHDSEWSSDLLDELAKECGGAETAEWKREALAEDVIDASRAIVPEYDDEAHVAALPRPEHARGYVGMDPGLRDLCGIVMGYWDFERAQLVVTHDWAMGNAATWKVAGAIKDLEQQAFTGLSHWDEESWEYKPAPAGRVSDTEKRLIVDLAHDYQLVFRPAQKTEGKEASLNALRGAFRDRKIVIAPECVSLRAHLRGGMWNTSRTDFERSEALGHLDLIDALKYLWRIVERHIDPCAPEWATPPSTPLEQTSALYIKPPGEVAPREQSTSGFKNLFPDMRKKVRLQ